MKKLVILVALFLSICLVACAEAPSKTTDDLTDVTVTDAANCISVSDDEAKTAKADTELDKLAAATTPDEYFKVAPALTETLDADQVAVNEFFAIDVNGYDEETMGDLLVVIECATPYADGEKVVVLVGAENEEGYEWTAFDGVGNADGAVEFTIDRDTMLKIKDQGGLIAVVNKVVD